MNTKTENLNARLGPVYDEIDQDVARIHAYWKLTLQLFGSQEAVDILNRSADFPIGAIQVALIDSVILRIAKLTDPAKSSGRFENLSLAKLIETLPSAPSTVALCGRLSAKLGAIDAAAAGMRTHRNKRIAHRDHASAIDPNAVIPGVPRSAIEESLRLIREFMHEIQRDYGNEGTVYDLIELGRDGNSLLFRLLCGHKLIDLHEGLQRGRVSESEVIAQIKQLPSHTEGAG